LEKGELVYRNTVHNDKQRSENAHFKAYLDEEILSKMTKSDAGANKLFTRRGWKAEQSLDLIIDGADTEMDDYPFYYIGARSGTKSTFTLSQLTEE
jgi:hypothetical protein